jgi:diadenosine tetraphosphate (Ap4A) HIT family hydrolase
MMTDTCTICALVAGRSPAPGGVIRDDGLWVVLHHPGAHADPGELFIALRRHAESLGQLTDAEAAALGPLLRAGVAAIEHVVEPERVYAASFNERARHVHVFLLPRTRDVPAGHILSDLYRRARGMLRGWHIVRDPSVQEREEAAERIRAEPAWPRLPD